MFQRNVDHQSNRKYPHYSVSEAKEEQNTVVSNSKGSLIPPSCSFEGEDPITNHNTVATCTNIVADGWMTDQLTDQRCFADAPAAISVY